MAMTLVSTVTVGSGGAASIEFTNIPQTGKDLLVLVSARNSGNSVQISMRLNNNSGANYSYRALDGSGAAASSFSSSGDTSSRLYLTNPGNHTANTFGNSSVYISNYAGSTNKSISFDGVTENNATTAYQALFAALWSQTTAISSLQILTDSPDLLAQHSTASLYIVS